MAHMETDDLLDSLGRKRHGRYREIELKHPIYDLPHSADLKHVPQPAAEVSSHEPHPATSGDADDQAK